MDELLWAQTVAAANADIQGIIRAQRVLEDVNRTLDERIANPIEEDRIFADGTDFPPGNAKVITVDEVEIRVRILHRRGLRQRDVRGADLIYEVAGRKFILVQYKNANASGHVSADHKQLERLIEACPNPCPPTQLTFWPTCGSWCNILAGSEVSCMPACRVKAVFSDAKRRAFTEFGDGISADVFQHLFARCWIGARIAPTELLYFGWSAAEADRVLFAVTQAGTFGRWPAV